MNTFQPTSKEVSQHDKANMLILPLITSISVYGLYQSQTDGVDANILLLVVGISYFILDSIWILIVPNCVKNPLAIVVHHFICIIMSCEIVWIWHKHQPSEDGNGLHKEVLLIPCKVFLVEFNTFLLILRRRYKLGLLFNASFFASWIGIRLVLFPYVVFTIILPWASPASLLFKGSSCALVFLQLDWTLRFIRSKNEGKKFL